MCNGNPLRPFFVIVGRLFPLEDVNTHAIVCGQDIVLHMNHWKEEGR